MEYNEVLKRYLILDLVFAFLFLLVITLAFFVIKKILPDNDSSNKAVRKFLYVLMIVGSVFAVCLASLEVYNISVDMQENLYISANGSFTTDRDRMYFISENGEEILLKIRPIIPDIESSEDAIVVYSKNSKILLEVRLE